MGAFEVETPLTLSEAYAEPGLLYMASFETADGWRGRGAWSLDMREGYSGASWVIDGTLRDTESLLEMRQWVELPADTLPILTFWHRGSLDQADQVWVEIRSQMNGTWSVLTELDIASNDWMASEINLDVWAGQLVQLR